MSIKDIKTDSVGHSGVTPKIVYISTDDTLATVTATGWLNGLITQGYDIKESDAFLITTKLTPNAAASQANWLEASKSGGEWSLIGMPSPASVTSVSGTAGRVTSTGGATPVIDIDAAYVGQTSLVTLGTVTSGVWSATGIAVNKGGTGVLTTTAYSVQCGGTTATGAHQNVAGVGTTGQVLTSAGAAALPAWSTPAGGGTSLALGLNGDANTGDNYITPWGYIFTTSASTPTVNKINFLAIYVPGATYTRIGVYVATGASSGTARLGLYEVDTDGSPGDLVLDAGTVDLTSTGALEITISQALDEGWYYICYIPSASDGSVRRGVSTYFGMSLLGATSISAASLGWSKVDAAQHTALSDPAVSALSTITSVTGTQALWVRVV